MEALGSLTYSSGSGDCSDHPGITSGGLLRPSTGTGTEPGFRLIKKKLRFLFFSS